MNVRSWDVQSHLGMAHEIGFVEAGMIDESVKSDEYACSPTTVPCGSEYI